MTNTNRILLIIEMYTVKYLGPNSDAPIYHICERNIAYQPLEYSDFYTTYLIYFFNDFLGFS